MPKKNHEDCSKDPCQLCRKRAEGRCDCGFCDQCALRSIRDSQKIRLRCAVKVTVEYGNVELPNACPECGHKIFDVLTVDGKPVEGEPALIREVNLVEGDTYSGGLYVESDGSVKFDSAGDLEQSEAMFDAVGYECPECRHTLFAAEVSRSDV